MKFASILVATAFFCFTSTSLAQSLERLKYNNPGLVVDLGVGLWAWPLPMDFDGDGDYDLVVNCPDKPYNGVYFFENTSGGKLPIFKPGKRISHGLQNVQVSYVDGKPRVLSPGMEYPEFLKRGLLDGKPLSIPQNVHPNRVRGNFWRYVDFDGDGRLDVILGADDWTDYGWDNGYDASGKWTRGPLRGFVYFVKNTGTNDAPVYANPEKVQAAGKPVEVFGWPSPNFADFDGDGDLDLLCGEFLDGFTYFVNTGTRTKPEYASGVKLRASDGSPLHMDLQMITPTAIDWDRDGDIDLIVGDEDGRVALIENLGPIAANSLPRFQVPRYFQQEADDVKLGALVTPVAFDWDGDGDTDIVSGNTAGYLVFLENLGKGSSETPRWAAPKYLDVASKPFRIMAGSNGSIQGPAEAKWGYTTLSIADWDGDKLPDVVLNSILGKVIWLKNIGTRNAPKLAEPRAVEVAWEGEQPHLAWGWLRPAGAGLLTEWRTTPFATDWNRDGLVDLIMLDHEGYLAFFERVERDGKRVLLPPKRVFVDESGNALRWNAKTAGASGRRKFCIVDWDGDGRLDFLLNSQNAQWWQQVASKDGKYVFADRGNVAKKNIEGHDTSPTPVNWGGAGPPDLVIGAEDGRLYYLKR